MGTGLARQKKAFKLQFMNALQKEVQRLQGENKLLKEDPNSVVGQFLTKYSEAVQQNNRLSALTASLIKMNGDRVVVSKEMLEGWKDCRLQIKVETLEGVESLEEAKEFVFTYEKLPINPAPPQEFAACTDPSCTLPKDFAHAHAESAPVDQPPIQEAANPEAIPVS